MTIQQMMLGGLYIPAVNWNPVIVTDARPDGDLLDSFASASFASNGTRWTSTSMRGDSTPITWNTDGAPASDFSLRGVVSSGVTPTGSSVNTWISMSTGATWTVVSISGTRSTSMNITLRHNPSNTEWTTTLTLTAQKGIL